MSELNHLEQRVLNQAVSALRTINASYCIRIGDLQCGDLSVAQAEARKNRKPRFQYGKHYGILTKVATAKPGQVIEFEVEPERRKGAQSALCNALARRFGNGCYTTEQTDKGVAGMGQKPESDVEMRPV